MTTRLSQSKKFVAAAILIADMRRQGHLIRKIVARLKQLRWPYASESRVNKVLRKAGLVKSCPVPEPEPALVILQEPITQPKNWAEKTVCEINEEVALTQLNDEMDAFWGREIPAHSPRVAHALKQAAAGCELVVESAVPA